MTRPAPPPAALSVAPAKSRLGRIARMDRAALRELLSQQGALIDAALAARDVDTPERDALASAVAKAMWAEAALLPAPAPEERAFVLALSLAARPLPSLEGTGLDAALVTRLCARVVSGVASASEQRLLEAQRAADGRIDEAARQLEDAHARAATAAAGPGRVSALWPALEPTLK